jgi:mono/diheme cytochrome c family protein
MKYGFATLAAAVLLFTASGALSQSNDSSSSKTVNKRPGIYGELAKAPGKARDRRNPLENDPQAVAAGRNLFEQHCTECHGESAEGGKKAPTLRATEVQEASPGAIFWILTNGVVRRGMPVWSKLPEPQRWQLVSYIKSLGVPAVNETFPSQRTSSITVPSSRPRSGSSPDARPLARCALPL